MGPQALDNPLQEIEGAPAAFVRSAPLPDWAELGQAPPVPPQASRRPVVVRLWETHMWVGASPIRLTHRVSQINDVGASDAGQLALEFHPHFERLLLHKIAIVRGTENIDHTSTAPVRFLQREPKLEAGVYSGVVTAFIVLPGVRTGDTLQVVYSVVGENPALGTRFSHQLPWDRTFPIGLRRVTLLTPVQRQVAWRWFGGAGGDGPKPVETVDAGTRRLRFESRDLPAARAEPMMPPRTQAVRELQLSEYANWNQVARWALTLFPTDIPLPEELTLLVARLRALQDPQEQASQALQWVQREIRPWSAAVGECALRPQMPALVLQRGWGDCKGKSLLLTGLLRALGIDARPTLVAAAVRHDPASMLPAPGVFDHVIVQARVAGHDYYLDPTLQGQVGLLSRIGQRFEGSAVLPVDAETQALVIVRSPRRSEIFRSQLHERLSLARFDAEGRLDVEIRWFGSNAESVRMSLQRMNAAELRHFVAAGYQQQYVGARLLGEPQVDDDRRLNQVIVRAGFVVPQLARPSGRNWAVQFVPSLGDAVALPNRLLRRFPLAVPSYPVTYVYQVDMNWPEGARLPGESLSQRLDTPHFRMQQTRSVRGHNESRRIEFAAKVSEVPAVEVESLVNDLNRMVEQIGGVMLATGGNGVSPPTPHTPPQPEGDSMVQPATEPR